MSVSQDFTFKLILIGEAAVGKSCLLRRFMNKEFQAESFATIGVDFEKKFIELDGHVVKLLIWDTAGHERFRAVTRSYYRGAMGAILVYDITNRLTYERVQQWLSSARDSAGEDLTVILIGNKCDLNSQRDVTFEEARRFAEENGILHAECSAKDGVCVENAFLKVVQEIYRTITDSGLQRQKSKKSTVSINTTKPKTVTYLNTCC